MNVEVALGSMGWDTEQTIVVIDPTDHVALCRVQLFDGRDLSQIVTPGRAQGRRILAQLSGPIWDVPSKDSRVLVALPMAGCDGAAVLLGRIGVTPAGFGNTRAQLEAQGRPIDIFAPEIVIGDSSATFAALASKVDSSINAIINAFNAHFHTVAATPGPSTPPTVAMSGQPTTACERVKIK